MSNAAADSVRVLHAVRVMGYAPTARIAGRLGLSVDDTDEHLLDAEARGWTTVSRFADDQGWSLTESGTAHGERLLAAELDDVGARTAVEEIYQRFLPLNDVVAGTCTAWQLSELGIGTPATPARTIAALEEPAAALAGLETHLTKHLSRFSGYHHRFTEALAAAHAEPAWITGTDRDSCHRVWFELHEDLIATLGRTR